MLTIPQKWPSLSISPTSMKLIAQWGKGDAGIGRNKQKRWGSPWPSTEHQSVRQGGCPLTFCSGSLAYTPLGVPCPVPKSGFREHWAWCLLKRWQSFYHLPLTGMQVECDAMRWVLGSQEGKISMGCVLQGFWACAMMALEDKWASILYSPKAAWESFCPKKRKKKERCFFSPSKNAWYNPTGKQFDNLFQKLNLRIPDIPTLLLLGINLREIKTQSCTKEQCRNNQSSIPIFTLSWKQAKLFWVGIWIDVLRSH